MEDEGQETESTNEGADTEVQDTGEAFNRWLALIDEVATIDEVLQSIHDKTREIYQFYLDKPFYTTTEEHRIVSIFIETTKEVEQII